MAVPDRSMKPNILNPPESSIVKEFGLGGADRRHTMEIAMDLRTLARRQLADYDRHQPGTLFAQRAPRMTIAQAYEIQAEVAWLRQERGEQIAGYKIGCVSPAIQAQLGIAEPVFGYVYATELHSSGALLDPDRYDCLAVEGEVAVRLGDDGAIRSA